jgi:hypothetical protein
MISIGSIESFCSNLTRNTFGIVVTANTEPKMRKTNNPYMGRVRKVSTYTNVALGRDYQAAVNSRLEQSGEKADFVAAPPRGMHHYGQGGFLLQSDSDESKYYLRLTMNRNTKIESRYMVDGRAATDAEVAEIKTFLPSVAPSAKQAASGLSDEDQVRLVSVNIENIEEIRQGNRVLN